MNKNIENIITTENQKPSFKYFDRQNIKLQRNYELFSYVVGYGKEDFSLTSFFTAFSLSAGTGSYGGIRRKFYENQSLTSNSDYDKIKTSSYVNNNIGSLTATTIIVFLLNGLLQKDGISNINPEKNILMNFSAIVYDNSLSSTISWGINDGRNINYILYDRKISSTAGNLVMRINNPDPNGELALSGILNTEIINTSDLIVGKIFYDYGIIIIDSWQNRQISSWTLSGRDFYYYIPYPISNPSTIGAFTPTFNLTAGTIPIINQDFTGFYFNTTASATVSGFFTSIYLPTNSILMDNVEVITKLNKNSYILEIPILQKDFNYSTNRLRIENGDEIIPEATEENPIWFNKIGLYDYKNNLLAVAKLNIPIKNSNKRTMIIKIKADY